jgi:hypothetical protein
MYRFPALFILAACAGDATWAPETWGEEYLERGIPAETFEDGCSATFEHFFVRVESADLVDADGAVVAGVSEAMAFDMSLAGPHPMPEVLAPAGFYDTARFVIASGDSAVAGNADHAELDGHAVRAVGALTCGSDTVSFDLSFDGRTTYDCAPEDLTLSKSGPVTSQLTVHGDHLFYDGLENNDAVVRGQAWIDADANNDGTLTEDELRATPVAPLGYDIGSQGDVADLFAFTESLMQGLGHIDGEGHCDTTRE